MFREDDNLLSPLYRLLTGEVFRFQFIGALVGGIASGVAGSLIGGLLGDDYGAEGMNDAAAELSRAQAGIARDEYGTYKNLYLPAEQQLVREARAAGSLPAQEAAAGRAHADITQAFDRARRGEEMRLRGFGIDVGSPAHSAAMSTVALSEAAADAGAQTSARQRERDVGYEKLFGIAQLGRRIPGQASGAAGEAASRFGIMGSAAYLQSRQNAQDAGYLWAPAVKAFGDWTGSKINSWFGPSSTQPGIAGGTPNFAQQG